MPHPTPPRHHRPQAYSFFNEASVVVVRENESDVMAMARLLVQPAGEQQARRAALWRLASELNARALGMLTGWLREAAGAGGGGAQAWQAGG